MEGYSPDPPRVKARVEETAGEWLLWPLVPTKVVGVDTLEVITCKSQVSYTLVVGVPSQTAQGAIRSRTL